MTNEQFLVDLADFLKSRGVKSMWACTCCAGINVEFSDGNEVVSVSYYNEDGTETVSLAPDKKIPYQMLNVKRKPSGEWEKETETRINDYSVETTWSQLEIAG